MKNKIFWSDQSDGNAQKWAGDAKERFIIANQRMKCWNKGLAKEVEMQGKF